MSPIDQFSITKPVTRKHYHFNDTAGWAEVKDATSIERSYYLSNYSRPFATAHRHHDGVAYEHLHILGITMCCSLLILSQVRCHIPHGLGRQPATYSLHMCKAPVPDIPVAPIQSQVMSVVLSGCNIAYCTSQISVHKTKISLWTSPCPSLVPPPLAAHVGLHPTS